jgi:hypothetical protein
MLDLIYGPVKHIPTSPVSKLYPPTMVSVVPSSRKASKSQIWLFTIPGYTKKKGRINAIALPLRSF